MANLLRDSMPVLHEALKEYLSDPVVFHRFGGSSFSSSASPLSPAGDEPVQQGNNLRLFMSLSQCGNVAPTTQDRITKNGTTYRVTDVVADDYDGFNLSLRKS
jgi:hypothetical protein